MNMFCYQCEQALGGKKAETSGLQDLLMYELKGIGYYGQKLIENRNGIGEDAKIFISAVLFSTLTNVNFDDDRFLLEYLPEAKRIKKNWRMQQELIEMIPRKHYMNNQTTRTR